MLKIQDGVAIVEKLILLQQADIRMHSHGLRPGASEDR